MISHTSAIIANLAAGLCIVGCFVTLVMAWVAWFWSVPAPRSDGADTPVSILKPLSGSEPELFSRLASYCRQDHPGPLQLVFGTLDDQDPTLKTVERLKLAFPEMDIATVAGGPTHGTNPKISNLINMQSLARHETILLSDSDILIRRDHVKFVVAGLQQPGVGAVTCLYHGLASGGLCARLSAMAINSHFLPAALIALRYRIFSPCFGATICLRASTLERTGGLRRLASVLADDYMLGEAIRQSGERVALAPGSIGHVCFEACFKHLVDHQIRVARTIKSLDPVGYLGLAVTHPFAWAMVACLCGSSPEFLLAALVSRLAVLVAVERTFRAPRLPYWLLPLHDALAFLVYLASFGGAGVVWRGARMRVQMSDGILTRDEGSS